MENIFKAARKAAQDIIRINEKTRSQFLMVLADKIRRNADLLTIANDKDLEKMDDASPLYDRLLLTRKRIEEIADNMENVARLPSPLDITLEDRTLANGLRLRKVSVPFGVIGVIYEARPNVTADVFALCFKAGSACLLKGGKDAAETNFFMTDLIRQTLRRYRINEDAVQLLPSTHEATETLLSAKGQVDLCIPRGGKRLIDFVRDNAKVPVIETGAGVVNTYFDEFGDTDKGAAIICNAKTRRVSVCNALDCLIIHRKRESDLSALCKPLADRRVRIYADGEAYRALTGSYPEELLRHATQESYGTEFMDYAMAVKTVGSIDEALEHISRFGSGHSECIITEDDGNADLFRKYVDAACVYRNAPTSFTDGGQFGLGAEIGISTQKLGPRGPMGLREITTYKWLIDGNGQVRV